MLLQKAISGEMSVFRWDALGIDHVTTGSISSSSNLLTVASLGPLKKNCWIRHRGSGVSGLPLYAQVLSVSGNVLTLDRNASTTVSGTQVITDDLNPLLNANLDMYNRGGGMLWLPKGVYNIQSLIPLRTGVSWELENGATLKQPAEVGLIQQTTGTGTSSSTSLTVGNVSGVANNQIAVIVGGGAGGSTLITWVNGAPSGSVVTLGNALGATVSGAVVRFHDSNIYDMFQGVAVSDVTAKGGTLDANRANQSEFHEGKSCCHLYSTYNVRFEGVKFDRIAGDAVTIVKNPPDATTTGCKKTEILYCTGLANNDNRNFVSATCFDGLTILGNRTEKIGRTDMPGDYDIEFSGATQRCANLTIDSNVIDHMSGTLSQRGIQMTVLGGGPLDNVSVVNNHIMGPNVADGILLFGSKADVGAVTMDNNTITNLPGSTQRGIIVYGGCTARLGNNPMRNVKNEIVSATGSSVVGPPATRYHSAYQLSPGSGRNAGKINPVARDVAASYSTDIYFAPNTNITAVSGGKFIHNNTGTSGGTPINQDVADLLTAMGRTTVALASTTGPEFYLAQYTLAPATASANPYTASDTIVRYAMTINANRLMAGMGNRVTTAFWIRVKTASRKVLLRNDPALFTRLLKDGAETSTDEVNIISTDGWVHIVKQDTILGTSSILPNIYIEADTVVLLALPCVFPGEVNPGLHAGPIPTLNDLLA